MACDICGNSRAGEFSTPRMSQGFHCPECGSYEITGTAQAACRSSASAKERADISVAIQQRQPEVVMVTSTNWAELLASVPQYSTTTKLRRLLEVIARRWPDIGQEIQWEDEVAKELRTRVPTKSLDELQLLVNGLVSRGLLHNFQTLRGYAFWGSITLAGWQELEPAGGGVKGRCFVAMSFHESLDDAYHTGIRRGIEDAGMDPRRIKEIATTEKICDRLLAEIRAAECVLADLTQFRPNVLFEAGYALALGKPVIYTCRADEFDAAVSHFDTRQYPHLKWTEPADLRTTLRDRLRALGVALKYE
jgi:nucleoside 2-deoxyribosyltransferase